MERSHLEWRDLVRCGMELMRAELLFQMELDKHQSPTWDDVVDEITASCVRRSTEDSLWQTAGSVGVLHGAAPVMWVHGDTDGDGLAAVLNASPEVDEVYVSSGQPGVAETLRRNGWTSVELSTHLVHDGRHAPEVIARIPVVRPLQPGDMADVRQLMRDHAGIDEAQLLASYPDNFFEVAAPVWLFGARDDAGRLVGVVAVRRQGRSAMGFALTVDPAWRSTGLSTALITAGVRQASAIGADFIHAQANERSARRLVECGFTVVGAWERLVRS